MLGKIIRSCNTWENSSSTADKVKADQIASGALKALFTVSGSYPELEEDEEFLKLRKELIRLEELIADIRQRYNRAAGVYNTILKRFPNNLLSGPLKLFPRELFPQEDEGLRRPACVASFSLSLETVYQAGYSLGYLEIQFPGNSYRLPIN